MRKICLFAVLIIAVVTGIVLASIRGCGYYNEWHHHNYEEMVDTTVTVVEHTSFTQSCAGEDDGEGDPTTIPNCFQTHHNITFEEEPTGEKFYFHGWTQSKRGEVKLKVQFINGVELQTKKSRKGGILALYNQGEILEPNGAQPRYWCFMEYDTDPLGGPLSGGYIVLSGCGMFGGTTD